MYATNFPKKRYKHTLEFLKQHIAPTETILDLGVENPLSEILKTEGYTVSNTSGRRFGCQYDRFGTDYF